MAISNEIQRLQNAANIIKAKTASWGIAETTDKLDTQAERINGIQSYEGGEITPTNEDQTIEIKKKFNTGNITIKGVNYYYTGSEKPSDSEHNDGDIFLVI